MIYQKVICIDNKNDNQLIVNKLYIGKRPSIRKSYELIGILETSGRPLGLFPSHMFKTLNQYRSDRLKNIFNE